MIYLDHNATAPVRPAVIEAMAAILADTGNPSSIHAAGRRARRHVEAARAQVGALVGMEPERVVFTSGGTEANNLALLGLEPVTVLVSAVEHGSVRQSAPNARIIPVNGDGVVDLAALERLLVETRGVGTVLVSVMLANNETGVIQPVAEIARLAHAHGALCHTDAIQAAGKIALDMAGLGVDLLTLSAHKIGGPQGVGAIVTRDDEIDLTPILRGGGQEGGRRGGTENVAGIVGFGLAASAASAGLMSFGGLAEFRRRLETRIAAEIPEARILGRGAERVPNTTNVVVPGVSAQNQVMALDLAGMAVSSGSACSSGKVAPSAVLRAMGLSADDAASAIRISLGWNSRSDDVDFFMDAWRVVLERAGCKVNSAAMAA